MDLVDLSALTLVAAAVAGVVNHAWLRLPHTISLVLFSLVASVALTAIDALTPETHIAAAVEAAVTSIDFRAVVMEGLLGFLLFAGAMHVNMGEMSRHRTAIALMATLGIAISTTIIGGLTWIGWNAIGISVPLIVCLAFGALISPTDPVAVLGILKTVRIPRSLEAKIAGESLFNDGVAVVVFAAVMAAAATHMGGTGEAPTAGSIAALFLRDAVGGAALGAATGWIAYLLLRRVDDHAIEIMVTLALVVVIVALGRSLHVSAPIGVVVAGLIIGSFATRRAMSEHTRTHLASFWGILDESLNSVLFLLLGILALAVSMEGTYLIAAIIAIPIVLAARFVSVNASMATVPSIRRKFTRHTAVFLTWGGLRGAISLAMAVSLPEGPYKGLIVTVTYLVVIFSVVVQGLTVKRVISMTVDRDEARMAAAAAAAEDVEDALALAAAAAGAAAAAAEASLLCQNDEETSGLVGRD